MKKINKKSLLSIIVCLCALVLLLTSFATINVFADSQNGYVAEVNSVKYQDYEDAWSAVSEDGGTITMLADWTINGSLVVDKNQTITLNMNGFMINRGLTSSTSDGEVFWVKDNAVLTINGEKNSTTEHKGTIQADMWHYNAKGNHTIYGALITGGYSSNGGGAIHVKENAQVNINNVTIAGNATSDGQAGGAIKLDNDGSTVTLYDSEICYNKATGGGGGAIRVEGENTTVQILGTKINNNTVTKGSCDGGAIQINNGTVSIAKSSNRVSEISFNSTTRNGGAIYVANGNLFLHEGTIVARNNAGKEGGAIYVQDDSDRVEIKGIFTGNFATEEGGAIYINSNVSGDNGAKISNAEFLGNRSLGNGGAIYVDADDDVVLSGKVIVNGNTPNNLYIQKTNTIVSNFLTSGSKVGITTSWNATSASPISTSNYQYFVSDKMECEIAGNSNSVYFVEATMGAPETITVNGTSYPVTKGVFVYNSVSGDQMPAYFYYSDAYFVDSARYYNEHLVTMSACVAIAGVTSDYSGEYTEEKGSKNIVGLFEAAGFTNIYVHYPKPEFFGADCETISTIGYVIASREITINGVTQTLIAVALRGGAYAEEWASNFILGDGVGEAKIFSHIADQVEEGLYNYIEQYGLNPSDSKFWLSGFSRGGATTNLLGKRLTDRYGEDDVYTYCFEAPKGGVYSELQDGLTYANIHCVINATDIVPFVGTTEMGFMRYGVDHYMPKYQVGTSDYEAQRAKMLEHLAAVDPVSQFKDEFHEATIEYIESVFGKDLIQKVSSPTYKTAATWNPVFIQKVQEYSFTNNVNDSVYNKDSVNWYGYRYFWSSYKWYLYEENGDLLLKCYDTEPDDFDSVKYTVLTLEDTVVNVMHLIYSGYKDAILEAIDLSTLASKIDKKDFWWDIVGEWHNFSIDKKNEEFNKLWDALDIETSIEAVLTPEDFKTLKTSIFVVVDFALDFLGEDYCKTDQNLLGTLVYNISSIMQTHHYEILNAWTRSFDSFYAAGDMVAPPFAPEANVESGVYNTDISIQLTADSEDYYLYYTVDGTTPIVGEQNCIPYYSYRTITFKVDPNKSQTIILKTIAVYNGVVSDVNTYTYTLTVIPELVVSDKTVKVSNLNGNAYLVLAEYDGDVLLNIEHYPVANNSEITRASSSLNFNNTVMAYLVRDIQGYAAFNPLCDAVCLTEEREPLHSVNLNAQNIINIESFEAKESKNPEYIDITFSIMKNNAQFLIVALFDKDFQSDFDNALFFGQIEKTEDNTYSFTIKRSRWLEVINHYSVKDRSLVLTVAANGIPEKDSSEVLWQETVYTITYHLNGGINNSNNFDTYTMSDELVLYYPTKEHYNFVDWYTNKYLDDGYDIWVIPAGTYGNIDLYAKWDPKIYSVIYTDGVDGEDIFPTMYLDAKYNTRTPSFGANPTREGYNFIGWDKEVSYYVVGDVVYTAVWEKHVHTEVVDEAVAPTCTETGLTEGKHCSQCNKVLVAQETVPSLGHDYNAVVIAPDCVTGGYTTYTCKVCGDTYIADQVASNGHSAGEAVVENNITADCVNNGSYDNVVYCTVCDVEISRETKAVDALGHTLGAPATCTEDQVCTVCGEIIVEKLGHSYNSAITLPTCEEKGYTTYTCSCGDAYISDEVAALGHDWVDATTEAPKTCNTCGATEGENLPSNDNPNLSIYEILMNFFIRIFNAIKNFFQKIGG